MDKKVSVVPTVVGSVAVTSLVLLIGVGVLGYSTWLTMQQQVPLCPINVTKSEKVNILNAVNNMITQVDHIMREVESLTLPTKNNSKALDHDIDASSLAKILLEEIKLNKDLVTTEDRANAIVDMLMKECQMSVRKRRTPTTSSREVFAEYIMKYEDCNLHSNKLKTTIDDLSRVKRNLEITLSMLTRQNISLSA